MGDQLLPTTEDPVFELNYLEFLWHKFLFSVNYLEDEKERLFSKNKERSVPVHCFQCDQIGRIIGLLATYQSLGQQLISPNLLHS